MIINENNIKEINDFNIQNRIYVYYFFCFLFAFLIPIFPVIIGYSLNGDYFAEIFAYCLSCSFLILFILFSIKFINFSCEYDVFNKKYFPYLFIGILLILSLPISLATLLRAPKNDISEFFETDIISLIFFLVIIPLFYAFYSVCNYLFGRTMFKYSYKRLYKDKVIDLKTEKKHFYNRFINENNLISIDDFLVQRDMYIDSMSLPILALVVVVNPTFLTYNLMTTINLVLLSFSLLCLIVFLHRSIRFIYRANKYNLFNKKYYSFLFIGLWFLLVLSFLILAIFTTKVLPNNENTIFQGSINPAYFLLIFVPLLIGYSVFCYLAFIRCFAKYAKRKIILKQTDDISNETSDVK
jgi:hypothetical protein